MLKTTISSPPFMADISRIGFREFEFSGNQFVGFVYETKSTGELASYVLQVGVSYESLLVRDLERIRALKGLFLGALGQRAVGEIEKSLLASIEAVRNGGYNPSYTCKETYESLGKGLKKHKQTGEVYACGLIVNKKVLRAGEPRKKVNSRELTLAKKAIDRRLRRSKWRQLSLDYALRIRTQGKEFTAV